jgi:hypothetical protein
MAYVYNRYNYSCVCFLDQRVRAVLIYYNYSLRIKAIRIISSMYITRA